MRVMRSCITSVSCSASPETDIDEAAVSRSASPETDIDEAAVSRSASPETDIDEAAVSRSASPETDINAATVSVMTLAEERLELYSAEIKRMNATNAEKLFAFRWILNALGSEGNQHPQGSKMGLEEVEMQLRSYYNELPSIVKKRLNIQLQIDTEGELDGDALYTNLSPEVTRAVDRLYKSLPSTLVINAQVRFLEARSDENKVDELLRMIRIVKDPLDPEVSDVVLDASVRAGFWGLSSLLRDEIQKDILKVVLEEKTQRAPLALGRVSTCDVRVNRSVIIRTDNADFGLLVLMHEPRGILVRTGLLRWKAENNPQWKAENNPPSSIVKNESLVLKRCIVRI